MNWTYLNFSLADPNEMFLDNQTMSLLASLENPFLSSKGDNYLLNRINLSSFLFPGIYDNNINSSYQVHALIVAMLVVIGSIGNIWVIGTVFTNQSMRYDIMIVNLRIVLCQRRLLRFKKIKLLICTIWDLSVKRGQQSQPF